MKLKLVASATAVMMAAVIGAQTASAITIDYRHEFYTDFDHNNKDRVMISDRLSNGIGYSVETKTQSGGEDNSLYSEMHQNGAEFGISYQFKPFDGWTFQPGFNAEFTSGNAAIYKPLFRVQYTFDNGFYIAARYRYEYTRNNDENVGSQKADEHLHRYEGWLGYRYGDWRGEFNYIWRNSDQNRWHGNHTTDYEYDFKLSYDINKSWTPYIQVGNVKKQGTKSDHRQTRYRIGIQYKY